jgi:hypothetical protein
MHGLVVDRTAVLVLEVVWSSDSAVLIAKMLLGRWDLILGTSVRSVREFGVVALMIQRYYA